MLTGEILDFLGRGLAFVKRLGFVTYLFSSVLLNSSFGLICLTAASQDRSVALNNR
jgi:hypothetical protein